MTAAFFGRGWLDTVASALDLLSHVLSSATGFFLTMPAPTGDIGPIDNND